MPRRIHRFTALLAALLLLALPTAPARANSDIGVVVLHGLTGRSGDHPTAPLLQALINAGYAIQAPEMCWSQGRVFDALFPDCLRQIDTAVAALRAAGSRRIVVAGLSLGGLAAIIYGTQHPDLAGVIAMAPAGTPESLQRFPEITQSIAKAHQLIAAGQGGQRIPFPDINAGSRISVAATPAVYLSFVEPGGPADFPQRLPTLHVPIIWVSGTLDRTQRDAATMYATIPANPLNRFVQVISMHLDTPAVGASAALDWLKTLPAH